MRGEYDSQARSFRGDMLQLELQYQDLRSAVVRSVSDLRRRADQGFERCLPYYSRLRPDDLISMTVTYQNVTKTVVHSARESMMVVRGMSSSFSFMVSHV